MQDTFKLDGHYSIRPPINSTTLSGDMSIESDLHEELALTLKYSQLLQLTVDGPQVINMGGITSAALLIVKSDFPISLILTSILGVAVVPVDKFIAMITSTQPITALSVQRPTGLLTTVRLTLGQL